MARKKFYRINQSIRTPKLRVINEAGKQIGILTLAEAFKKAKELEVDLVEIAPGANPPVAKLINFKKFLYQEEKKEREAKKGIRGGEVKGIRLTPFIAKGDFELRVKRAEEFLKEGNKVKVTVKFLGRQLGKKEFGYEVLNKFVEALSLFSAVEQEPKWFGRYLILTLTPIKGGKNGKEEKTEK